MIFVSRAVGAGAEEVVVDILGCIVVEDED